MAPTTVREMAQLKIPISHREPPFANRYYPCACLAQYLAWAGNGIQQPGQWRKDSMATANIIRSLRTRAVLVPLQRPVTTSNGVIASAPLVLVDIDTELGITGRSYVFCYTPLAMKPIAQLIDNLGEVIAGDALVPFDIERKMQSRFVLLGPQGLAMIAMAAIDMAVWDALAKSAGLPLATLLGGKPRAFNAYESLGKDGIEAAASQAADAKERGFNAVKIKVGYPTVHEDVAVIRAVRRVIGDEAALMVDYNQALSMPEAQLRLRALDDEGLVWIEEPIRCDDYAGHAQLARMTRTPLQGGENWWGPHDMAASIAAGAFDHAMPDVMKMGGVTGWMRAAALAEPRSLPVSSHLFCEISAHLLAVTPTALWLEHLDLARPVLQEPVKVVNGMVTASDKPGADIEWDEDAVRRYLVE